MEGKGDQLSVTRSIVRRPVARVLSALLGALVGVVFWWMPGISLSQVPELPLPPGERDWNMQPEVAIALYQGDIVVPLATGNDWAACTNFGTAWTSYIQGDSSRVDVEAAAQSAKQDASSQTMVDAINEIIGGDRAVAGLPVCPNEETREPLEPTVLETPLIVGGGQ